MKEQAYYWQLSGLISFKMCVIPKCLQTVQSLANLVV